MYNNSSQSDNKDFAIIGSFTRSLDTPHKENNRIHLISSICLVQQKDMGFILKYLTDYKTIHLEKVSYVFVLTPNTTAPEPKEGGEPLIIDKGSSVIIKCSIGTLLKNLFFTEESTSIFKNLFGSLNLEYKDFETISQNSIFIFLNQTWSNVVLNFKLNKVDLSGGSISKRHILHTVDIQLVLHLLNIFDRSELMSNIVYNSHKNPILSSSIPLDYYNKFLDRRIDILNMKVKDVNNNFLLDKDDFIYTDKLFYKYNSVEAIVRSNLSLSIEMLIADITNGIKSELEKLNNTNNKYSNDLSLLSYEKSKFEDIDTQTTKYMKNKEKKDLKKKELKWNHKVFQVSYLN
uniref:RNA polymerase n=1 Tax=Dichomitus squalens TaxID=114155 RepID=UPI003002619F|nr:RNA polymerase [Dichomitus squalens]